MRIAICTLFLVALAAWWRGFAREPAGSPDEPRSGGSRRSAPVTVAPLGPDQLCVTKGNIERRRLDGMHVAEPVVRAVATNGGGGGVGDVAELRFVYRGPTAVRTALASGEMRSQVGLKLRAQDGCNLVYVMWRLEPTSSLHVLVKRNRGSRVHSECGTRGYRAVAPRTERPPPAVARDSAHAMHAELTGQELMIWIDGQVAWEGNLGRAAADLAGPVGFRSDNVELDVELLAAPDGRGHRAAAKPGPTVARCAAGGDD